jgi:hypothetical protein
MVDAEQVLACWWPQQWMRQARKPQLMLMLRQVLECYPQLVLMNHARKLQFMLRQVVVGC